MLDSEGELIEEQPEVNVHADPEELVKREMVEHPEILKAATERKMRKFAPSGLIVLLVGVVLIGTGLFITLVNILSGALLWG